MKKILFFCFILFIAACSDETPSPTTPPQPTSSETPIETQPEPDEPLLPTNGQVIIDARIVGDPVYYPSMGDLWMSTWADDGRLYMTWGDGTGFGDGYPTTYPTYETEPEVVVPDCGETFFPCLLWCRANNCAYGESRPPLPLTDAGILVFTGPVPEFTDVEPLAINVPQNQPFFITGPEGSLDVDESAHNDKPSSLLYLDGRLYLAGHRPPLDPSIGYLAYSEDYGRSWTELPNSPWTESSNFRVLMFINQGQAYNLNQDGFVYVLGVGKEGIWEPRTVYLARVPRAAIADYNAYEYYTGLDGVNPHWSHDQNAAVPLDNLFTAGQGSAVYHQPTGRYLFMTTDGNFNEGQIPSNLQGVGGLWEAPHPWGPWSEVTRICFDYGCNDGSLNIAWTDGKYIPGLIAKDQGPNHIYFTVSGGDDHYQLQIGKLELVVAP